MNTLGPKKSIISTQSGLVGYLAIAPMWVCYRSLVRDYKVLPEKKYNIKQKNT